ncbi:hypothetical protein VcPa08_00115 [Vibrio cholerae]|nr:hypothetical protein DN30_116 [Vibrio cholerae]BCK12427.1 hypothetical protein VCSRO207_3527 [Vibrio cholerae]GFK32330.1 hypothetical protein VcPa01_00406 [Vibrio cholerae]GFK35802.1 hypothetical protein VcPa02_00324 [Vibrio cholerae]GFK39377.1 hypothetical protein VcPa03_00405 [Vibrio cholerae]
MSKKGLAQYEAFSILARRLYPNYLELQVGGK